MCRQVVVCGDRGRGQKWVSSWQKSAETCKGAGRIEKELSRKRMPCLQEGGSCEAGGEGAGEKSKRGREK